METKGIMKSLGKESCRGALVGLLALWGGMMAAANTVEPVLEMDFANGSISAGLGGTSCFDFSMEVQEPVVLDDPGLMKKLSGIKSLTVCGWVKRPMAFDDVESDQFCLMACPGIFEMKYNRWGNLILVMVGAEGEMEQIKSSWYSYGILSGDEQWVFVAFTYDATRSELNSAFYYGNERYRIMRDTFESADNPSQALADAVPSFLVVGAQTPEGRQRLNGSLDSIKIYASKEDGSAALSQSEIEMIRHADVGAESLGKMDLQALEEKRQKRMESMRLEDAYWSAGLNLHQVNSLTPVFSTKCPPPVDSDYLPCVPRGGSLPLMFVAMSRGKESVSMQIEVSPLLSEERTLKTFPFSTYEVVHVPVEANNNGGVGTTLDTRPPEMWQEHLIAEAPFKVGEVLCETQTIKLRENKDHGSLYKGILVDFEIPPDTEPGGYRGTLLLKSDAGTVRAPFSFQVADVVLDTFPRLDNIYWFTALPQNLTTRSELPELWSEEHWALIENSAKTLRSFGQTSMTINLVFSKTELANFIQTHVLANGEYRFDYSIFDRWFETFLNLGFRNLEGKQFFEGHGGGLLEVNAIKEETGEKMQIFNGSSNREEYYAFLEVFATDLYRHLKEKGWLANYRQTLIDEPTDLERYKEARAFAEKYLPGIPVKEACGNAAYSDYIDAQVFNIFLALQSYQDLAVRRRVEGKSVWFYHCCSPYPPYPNRHLDEPLACSRLYPWLTYLLNADGYLYWAANNYRFADPYKSSIGPLPGGGTNPGHPPGDNWMYYPGPDGLRGSVRMLAFREGLLDHALLVQLAEKNPVRAEQILKTIVRNPLDYSKDPSAFQVVRRVLLEALENSD